MLLLVPVRRNGSRLPAGLMPLLVFPGGYGGMVHSDGGRVSLSCCIRRDYLARCRRLWPNTKAAEAVIAHIRTACRGVDAALASDYAASWRRNFARRVHAAAVFAHLAMRPATAKAAAAVLKRAPAMLTLGAYLSGKAQSPSALQRSDQ